MRFTVRDAMTMEKFQHLQLVAGKNGLGREIVKIGILDYEFIKPTESSYVKGEFVMTSFLYAKDDESKILDAVKRLDECGISGIAIKKVFFDTLPQSVIDYANARRLPVFMLEVPLYFEDLIVEFSNTVRTYSDYSRYEHLVEKILKNDLSEKETEAIAKEIHTSIKKNSFFTYLVPVRPLNSNDTLEMLLKFKKFLPSFSCAIQYKNGFLINYSFNSTYDVHPAKVVAETLQNMDIPAEEHHIGIGNVHKSFSEYKTAIVEAINSARFCSLLNRSPVRYTELGIFAFLLPAMDNPVITDYTNAVITKIEAYDAENKTELLDTAIKYVMSGGNIKQTAAQMFQHDNTIRYRINKIRTLFFNSPTEYLFFEELAIIVQLYMLKKHFNN